jgi:hypothetical protein
VRQNQLLGETLPNPRSRRCAALFPNPTSLLSRPLLFPCPPVCGEAVMTNTERRKRQAIVALHRSSGSGSGSQWGCEEEEEDQGGARAGLAPTRRRRSAKEAAQREGGLPRQASPTSTSSLRPRSGRWAGDGANLKGGLPRRTKQ